MTHQRMRWSYRGKTWIVGNNGENETQATTIGARHNRPHLFQSKRVKIGAPRRDDARIQGLELVLGNK